MSDLLLPVAMGAPEGTVHLRTYISQPLSQGNGFRRGICHNLRANGGEEVHPSFTKQAGTSKTQNDRERERDQSEKGPLSAESVTNKKEE